MFDSYSQLGYIAAPTLIITGTEDHLIPTENSEILAQGIPHSKLLKLEGVGHPVDMQVGARLAKETISFLGSSIP